jgi:hypothetical protein
VTTHTEKSWKRHSNPWSVWTRVLTYPLVYLPLWNRSWKQGAAVAAWFAANLRSSLPYRVLGTTSPEESTFVAELGRT